MTTVRKVTPSLWAVCALAVVALPDSAASQPQFEEVTGAAGLNYQGQSWGLAWGDVNGDGWPDLWAGNHVAGPALWVNNGDGTFTDEIHRVTAANFTDLHGAAWADFDNDGDQDLLQLAGANFGGGAKPNVLLKNTGGSLSDVAAAVGLDYPLGSGRTPLFLDWNNDGLLDVFVGNAVRPDGQAPSALFTQQAAGFASAAGVTGLVTLKENAYAQLTRLTASATPTLLIHQRQPFPERLYAYDETPFPDLRESVFVPTVRDAYDSALADFDNDLKQDWYVTRLRNASEARQTDSSTAAAAFNINGEEHGVRFRASGPVEIKLDPSSSVSPGLIFIGRAGQHPDRFRFELDRANRGVEGWMEHDPGTDHGVYVGYSPEKDLWQIFASTPTFRTFHVGITVDGKISDVQPINFENHAGELADVLLTQSDDGFVEMAAQGPVAQPRACASVVAADFDNDADVDLYLVCRGAALNRHNVLLENTGNAVFEMVADAGGAAGSALGRGDVAAVADFDRDGFVDIAVTNGRGAQPFHDGPIQLYRNLGNGNAWVEFDLVGTQSNRDAIGARVTVTAAGVSQMRLQNGGMHLGAQDHQRLHFGLGQAKRLDSVVIEWPDGVVDERLDLAVNTVHTLIEP